MRDALLASWREVGDKIVALAEEFPAEKYEFRPAPGTRSFADQLRHLAFWNDWVRDSLAGGQPDGQANELPRDAYPTRDRILAALRDSFLGITSALDGNGRTKLDDAKLAMLAAFLEHCGEHYGQLVVYSRLNGIVPPATRTA
jgi:hypothetical protein